MKQKLVSEGNYDFGPTVMTYGLVMNEWEAKICKWKAFY